MHAEAYVAVAKRIQELAKPLRSVVEFGSRNINGSVRPLFPEYASYVGVDAMDGPDVDVVMDAESFVPMRAPNCVVCCEVLEHAANAKRLVEHALMILALKGAVIITCASTGRAPHSAVDGGAVREGEHYRNVTPQELRSWLEEAGAVFIDVEHHADRGDVYAMGFKP